MTEEALFDLFAKGAKIHLKKHGDVVDLWKRFCSSPKLSKEDADFAVRHAALFLSVGFAQGTDT